MPDATPDAAAPAPADGLRGPRERLLQTLMFECAGLLVMAPLLAAWTGGSAFPSLLALVALSCGAGVWSLLFNATFDTVEHRLTGRPASDRPHRLRFAHAIGFEVSSIVVGAPILRLATGLDWVDVLVVNLGLTIAYVAYGYAFHWGFDQWRPVAPSRARAGTGARGGFDRGIADHLGARPPGR